MSQKSRRVEESTKAPSLLAGRGLGVGFFLARDWRGLTGDLWVKVSTLEEGPRVRAPNH